MTWEFVISRTNLWLQIDKDEESRKEILSLMNSDDEMKRQELRDRMERDISFGTAGLRGEMRPGFNRINDITVQLATQGVADYLGDGKLVIVGHDHRHNSKRFAEMTTKVLQSKSHKVLNFSKVIPTPFVPFAVRKFKADFGIMITASHNPAKDNGYKVYASNGCQINSPVDKDVAHHIIKQNYQLIDLSQTCDTINASDVYDEVFHEYCQENFNFFSKLPCQFSAIPRIAYTAMHGVGFEAVRANISVLNLPPIAPVTVQCSPDPNFPTVKFPNPEEGDSALKIGLNFAKQENCKILFANDPDSDRFNFSEFQDETGNWKTFTGNEIAALFANFLLEKRSLLYPDIDKLAMVQSCVSSKLLKSMATQESFSLTETMTGFKNIANEILKIEKDGKEKVLFAFEEAIGFMVNCNVMDKDGISALLLAYYIVGESYSNGKTLLRSLINIYEKYGYFQQYNSYFYCQNVNHIDFIFQSLKTKLRGMIPGCDPANSTGSCQISIDCEATIFRVIDYPGNMVTLLLSLDGLSWITIRASGTEPKIKFYSEIKSKYSERNEAKEKLTCWVRSICSWLLEPEANNLALKSN